jgi:hypothetical protein
MGTLNDGRHVFLPEERGGFVHAPSMAHASTAAILGSVAASNGQPVDLSSRRVRKALRILGCVRSGEALGSALGSQFERGLLERDAALGLQLAVDAFRLSYPLVANKLANSGKPADLIAARNVVDGLSLLTAFRKTAVAYDTSLLPDGSTARKAVDDELRALEDTVDAMTDLLTAEGVFQSIRGNTAAAAATLETMSRGVRPPPIEIAHEPRSGTTITHRFAAIVGANVTPPPGWNAPPSRRSAAEPFLDAWIGTLLGDPSVIRCRTSYPDPNDASKRIDREVALAELSLRPIDFLAIARPKTGGGTSELEERIATLVNPPAGAELRIDHSPWTSRTLRTFPEIFDLSAAIRDVIQNARPLRPRDLVALDNTAAAAAVMPSGGTRGTIARQALFALKANLSFAVPAANVTDLRTALIEASQFGIGGAYPPLQSSQVDLVERGRAALKQVGRRLTDAFSKQAEDEIARAVFGRDFVFLDQFEPPQALDAPSLGGDALAPWKWLQKAAPVRPALAAWRTMSIYSGALGAPVTSLSVAQLPFEAGALWVALPFPFEAARPPSGRVSIVMHRAAPPGPSPSWAGLLIDEWSEVIPAASEQTSISFPYDHRRSEAPQTLLLAVQPDPRTAWELDTVADIVFETLQLAKVRAVDAESLGEIGQLLPALFVAANEEGDTVSANLTT